MKSTLRARTLRRDSTDAERKLWGGLRSRRFEAFKFRRQHPVGQFIVDFVCLECGLVIEVDGGQHGDRVRQDELRTRNIGAHGFRVIRFWNNDVLSNLEGVLTMISIALHEHPHPIPSPAGGRGVRNLAAKRRYMAKARARAANPLPPAGEGDAPERMRGGGG